MSISPVYPVAEVEAPLETVISPPVVDVDSDSPAVNLIDAATPSVLPAFTITADDSFDSPLRSVILPDAAVKDCALAIIMVPLLTLSSAVATNNFPPSESSDLPVFSETEPPVVKVLNPALAVISPECATRMLIPALSPFTVLPD